MTGVKVYKTSLIVIAFLTALVGCRHSEEVEAREVRRTTQFHTIYRDCLVCHMPDSPTGAPPVAGLPRWYLYKQLREFTHGVRGTEGATAQARSMRQAVRNLDAVVDLKEFSAFLAGLSAEEPRTAVDGSPEVGAALYEIHCNACHPGAGGRRGLRSPPLLPLPADYVLRQCQNFRDGRRIVDDNDAAGLDMSEAVSQLDDAELADIAAFLAEAQRVKRRR